MIAALEESPANLEHLVELAQRGEEVVLTKAGQPVAKITGIAETDWPTVRDQWLEELDRLRASVGTGRVGTSTEQIIEEIREERF